MWRAGREGQAVERTLDAALHQRRHMAALPHSCPRHQPPLTKQNKAALIQYLFNDSFPQFSEFFSNF
ncbi:hypothetical protein E2C01_078498 [Portunus trituberculatus]|uniref:Uncharacterized protein n=1 Tax=Portunus trituberculatus TaxID=210409 RepID=A0A5B7IIY5_PORTR|nr:hypothetical protein [Portunus trituberculatus]